jgi:glutathione S-transferase
MKLYQFDMSPNAKRVRVVAAEVGVPLTIVSLDPMKGEHTTAEYGAKNPNQMVPTLELDDGTMLWESTAICTYIAELDPAKRLLPSEARGRAEVARWVGWNAAHLEAALFTVLIEKMFAKVRFGREESDLKVREAERAVDRFAPILDAHLETERHVAGAGFTIADVCLAATIELMVHAKLFDLSSYRSIAAWLGRVQERPAWQAAS